MLNFKLQNGKIIDLIAKNSITIVKETEWVIPSGKANGNYTDINDL